MSNRDEPFERWEYTMLLLTANPREQQAFFDKYAPGQKVMHYDYRAIIPQLDALGAEGWELVTLVPAVMGDNGDMFMGGGQSPYAAIDWAHTYLCTFKRRVR
jgi:hypothetical protein